MTVDQPPVRSLPHRAARKSAEANRLDIADRAAHDWYRFVLSFPPHLVRGYLDQFGIRGDQLVLDPFCGTGTTVVECKKAGVRSMGLEAHPLSHFAARTKVNWSPSPKKLLGVAETVAEEATNILEREGVSDDLQGLLLRDGSPGTHALRTLPLETMDLLLARSISPRPLNKVLVLLESIHRHASPSVLGHLRLALARELVTSIGNLHFGPEVGVGPPKEDVAVIAPWLSRVRQMADDLRILRPWAGVEAAILRADSRQPGQILPAKSVDAVITSPPYPNEKDYTRTTRLETVLLGFVTNKAQLQNLKRGMLLRSNTRNVYKADDDDRWVAGHPEVQRIAAAIEQRRIELGKTSGFERLYAKVTRLYFGGMARHLAEIRPALKSGAQLAYVVGDQASYLRIMIRTGQILASIAEDLGFEVMGIDLFRTRLATATREQLREEVVVLRWPGR
ncbi:MAG: DNA methyltransferase [Verrucomicrobia bacterium]|nr:DNA methyltransferase [Verrucomicrobiota bacterium]